MTNHQFYWLLAAQAVSTVILLAAIAIVASRLAYVWEWVQYWAEGEDDEGNRP